ncbi:MAG: hypothetical protein FJ275_01915, partial [Planctomycetes bacterium]|nr:hypothetical protein [Planctomycetota bacterium]
MRTTLFAETQPTVKFFNPAAAAVIGFLPTPTVWGRPSGRPIYDRLPAIGGAYVTDFTTEDRIRIYIENQNRATGAGTLQVGRWQEDAGILVVQSGTIVWRYGPVDVQALAIKLANLNDRGGLQDGEYQVGYLLRYEPDTSDRYKEYKVEDYSLAASATVYGATAAAEQFPVDVAFTDELDTSWRPTDSGYVGGYDEGQALILDFTQPCKAERFRLTASAVELATAKCTVYWSDDGIIWHLDDRTWEPKGGAWDMLVSEQTKRRYWKLFFWSGLVDVQTVEYTGTAFYADQRRTGSVSVAEPYLDELYEDIATPHIQLATLEVRDNQVVRVEDYRLSQLTYEKFQPVASWLTTFQDESIRKYFTDVERYAERWMAPPTAAYGIYDELLQEDTFEIGSELDYPRLELPVRVELEEGYYFTYDDIDIQVDGEQNFYRAPVLLDIPTPEIATETGIVISTQATQAIAT